MIFSRFNARFTRSIARSMGVDASKMSSRASTKGARFTATHECVRATTINGRTMTCEIAMADGAFEAIGDARLVEAVTAVGALARRGETLARVTWSGFARTAGDELYHSVWTNATGVREVKAPFDCVVKRFNEKAMRDAYREVRGPETWLVEVEAKNGELSTLLDEDEYEKVLEREEIEAADRANAAYP